MIETIQLRLAGYPDIPPADLRLVNGRVYGLFDAGDGAASALLAVLAGAALPAAGSVRVGGFDTALEPVPVGKCIGYAASDTEFYDRMTVWGLMRTGRPAQYHALQAGHRRAPPRGSGAGAGRESRNGVSGPAHQGVADR